MTFIHLNNVLKYTPKLSKSTTILFSYNNLYLARVIGVSLPSVICCAVTTKVTLLQKVNNENYYFNLRNWAPNLRIN